jgi:Family of unknown function (DUF6445)
LPTEAGDVFFEASDDASSTCSANGAVKRGCVKFDKMAASIDTGDRLFNANPRISVIPIADDEQCIVIDDVLADPQRLVEWAGDSAFEAPQGFPYPGRVAAAPAALTEGFADYFAQHVRARLSARRTLNLITRLSLITLAAEELEPRQWQCHRDRVADSANELLFAASVLYLFRDPALGGTSFYKPRQPPEHTDRIVADSQMLNALQFTERYGLQPGYMAGSNAYFERLVMVPARWNRAIFYDGSLFHSADVDQPALLSTDPRRGRLTLNAFFTCKRRAR